jgi:hypothetical protein
LHTGYQEKFTAAEGNNYEGHYAGHIVYYDWSRRHVTEIQPLQLLLTKTGSGYTGQWTEGNGPATPIGLRSTGGQLLFEPGNGYERTNHYSGRKPERWQFNSAQLALGFGGDSIVLAGAVRFYSADRREPGKPVQVILKKAMSGAGQRGSVAMTLLPNPAGSQASVRFTLQATAHITVSVIAQDGRVLYASDKQKLPSGTYTYPLPIANYMPGSYTVQLMTNGKAAATETLVKQ